MTLFLALITGEILTCCVRWFCGLSLPAECLRHEDRRQSLFTRECSSRGHNWHPEHALPGKREMKGPSQSWLSPLFKALQLMAYQTLWWDSNSWLETSFHKPIFPSKVPSPHLLEPWDMGKKGRAGMERRRRGKGQKGEGKGEQKKKTPKHSKQNADTVQVFWYFLSTLYSIWKRNQAQQFITSVTTTGSGQHRCSTNHIKESINKQMNS